ncbi:MAG: YcnI family protein [Actinomycetota bacterium]|nr:YcnI family protein [Actinomycetota bacterium]
MGTLPKQATLNLPATQTYSDGSVVKWDEPAKPDGPEAALRRRGGAALRARGRS